MKTPDQNNGRALPCSFNRRALRMSNVPRLIRIMLQEGDRIKKRIVSSCLSDNSEPKRKSNPSIPRWSVPIGCDQYGQLGRRSSVSRPVTNSSL